MGRLGRQRAPTGSDPHGFFVARVPGPLPTATSRGEATSIQFSARAVGGCGVDASLIGSFCRRAQGEQFGLQPRPPSRLESADFPAEFAARAFSTAEVAHSGRHA